MEEEEGWCQGGKLDWLILREAIGKGWSEDIALGFGVSLTGGKPRSGLGWNAK